MRTLAQLSPAASDELVTLACGRGGAASSAHLLDGEPPEINSDGERPAPPLCGLTPGVNAGRDGRFQVP